MNPRRHLTYANLVSSLALAIALGTGTSYAAAKLPKNSVTAKSIKAGAVKGSKLAADAVTSDKVANKSLTSDDLADSSVGTGIIRNGAITSDDLADSSVGTGIIRNGAITNDDLADGSVGLGKITANAQAELKRARAYGSVLATGTQVGARSSGATVTKVPATTGRYCVTPGPSSGISAAGTTLIATPVWNADNATPSVAVQDQPASCLTGWLVITQRETSVDHEFVDSDEGFTFMIP